MRKHRLGIALIVRQTGGRNGGGATLTPRAREFPIKIEKMERGLLELVDAQFQEMFRKRGDKNLYV